jgi:hypothetical protein
MRCAIDSHFPQRRHRIRPKQPNDPRECADCLRGDVARARFLLLNGAPSGFLAGSGPAKKA